MRPTVSPTPYLVRVAVVVALIALLSPGSALADTTVVARVVGGDRGAAATWIRFDRIVELDGHRYQFGSGTLTIDDASGTNAGWRVVVSAPGDGLVLTALSAPRLIVGQAIDAQAGPAAATATALGRLDTPRAVVAAEPGYGKGRYELTFVVAREIPAGGADDSVSLSVTITPAS